MTWRGSLVQAPARAVCGPELGRTLGVECAQALDSKPWKEQGVNQASCSSRTLGYRGPTRVSWIKFSQKKTQRQGFKGTSFTGEVVLKTQKGYRGSEVGQRRQLIKMCSQACYNGGQLELSPTGTSSVLSLWRGGGARIAGSKSQCWRLFSQ